MKNRFWKQWNASRTVIHRGPRSGILYQDQGRSDGAVWYIDQGWRNAFTNAGHRWAQWNHHQPVEQLIRTIVRLKPSLLLLNLHTDKRLPSPWVQQSHFNTLLKLKEKLGFKVACRTNPSNISDLFQNTAIDLDRPDTVTTFYLQADRPTPEERHVFESGFVDVFRSAFHRDTFSIAFRNYLDLGCKILEEPHAADLVAYPQASTQNLASADNDDFDILFVGGCWPFKWANMETYVRALKKRFGYRFRIYGSGWPENLSHGRLPEEQFNRMVQSAKINLTLHERSQTLAKPISGNERVFKLGALGCCTISDANPLIGQHFDPIHEVPVCRSAEAMVARCEMLMQNAEHRRQLARAHQARVVQEHSYEVRLQRIVSALESTEHIVGYKDVASHSSLHLTRQVA